MEVITVGTQVET
jgi:hypothetical protein